MGRRGTACRGRGFLGKGRRQDTDRDVGMSTAVLAFDSDVEGCLAAQVQADRLPGAEVVPSVDGAASVRFGANGPELGIGSCTLDRGRVGADLAPDLICATVTVDVAVESRTGVVGRVVHAHVLNNVIFNQRVDGPAVESEVGVSIAVKLKGACVVD